MTTDDAVGVMAPAAEASAILRRLFGQAASLTRALASLPTKLMPRKPSTYPQFPYIKEAHSENPARFLEACSTTHITPTTQSLIQGIQSLDRLEAWARVEHEAYGDRVLVTQALGRRFAALTGRNPGPTPENEEEIRRVGEHANDEVDDVDDTPNEDDEPEVITSSDPEWEDRLADARAVASMFEDVDAVKKALQEEIERDGPTRPAVVAALNMREDELTTPETDTRQEVPA